MRVTPKSGDSFFMFKISCINCHKKEEKNMTNHCYCPRGVFDMYRVENPVKLNLYCRKRLFHKGRLYWTGYDVMHKIHGIYTIMSWKIHRTMRRIVRFEYELVMAILRLNAPIRVAIMVALTLVDGCALIAIL